MDDIVNKHIEFPHRATWQLYIYICIDLAYLFPGHSKLPVPCYLAVHDSATRKLLACNTFKMTYQTPCFSRCNTIVALLCEPPTHFPTTYLTSAM